MFNICERVIDSVFDNVFLCYESNGIFFVFCELYYGWYIELINRNILYLLIIYFGGIKVLGKLKERIVFIWY